MAAPACPLLGDGITDDTLLHIAGFLPSAKDLLCLGFTNTRFSTKTMASAVGGAAAEMLSLVEEAGRLWVAGCSDQERGWVPRRGLESRLGLMQEVELLRVPLAFGRAHADITLSEGGAVATINGHGSSRAAASSMVMRSGRHFVQFAVIESRYLMFGVVRPGYDVEGVKEAAIEDGHCFYDTSDESGWSSDWEGRQAATEQGDRIGMLLDLDQGSMTVWKNDDKLGVMAAEGLRGPLCWAVTLYDGDIARIMSAPAPASPTEEDLVAAKAWQRRYWLGLPQTAKDAECEAAAEELAAAMAWQPAGYSESDGE